MTKEERQKAAVLAADREQLCINTSERGAFIHGFEAGAKAEAESKKSVSVQDAKQFMWEWLNRTDMLGASFDHEYIQLLMADFANHLQSPPLNQQ